ncbi:25599_t:CDS:1, partial [Dentiscutata erythropus]
MDKTHIIALAKNILNEVPKTLVTDVQIPKLSPCSLCDEGEIFSNPHAILRAFTMTLCGHLFHQLCLEKHLLQSEPRCPVYRCNKDIETTLSPSETELQEDSMEISPQMTEAGRGKDTSLTIDERRRDPILFESNADIGLSQALQNKDASSSAKNAIEPTSEICS